MKPRLSGLQCFCGLRFRARGFFTHGARTLDERAFDKELTELAQSRERSLAIVRTLSQPEDTAVHGSDYDHRGRIDIALTPEFACRSGSCRTALIEGKVAYAREPVAPTDPQSALICCAVPAAGERLLLDL